METWFHAFPSFFRSLCREYKILYKKKLLEDKASESLSKHLEVGQYLPGIDGNFPPWDFMIACLLCYKIINLQVLESKLDVLNITICRRQAAYEVRVDNSNCCLVLSFL